MKIKLYLLVISVIYTFHYQDITATIISKDGGSSVNTESGEMFLGDEYKNLGKESLQEMFGDRLIVADEDSEGKVTRVIVNGSGMIDATTGIKNGSGVIDLWFLGSFNLAESAGQGLMERDSMDVKTIPSVENMPAIKNIPGIKGRTDVLNSLMKSINP
jgi:hypothetical protein